MNTITTEILTLRFKAFPSTLVIRISIVQMIGKGWRNGIGEIMFNYLSNETILNNCRKLLHIISYNMPVSNFHETYCRCVLNIQ